MSYGYCVSTENTCKWISTNELKSYLNVNYCICIIMFEYAKCYENILFL